MIVIILERINQILAYGESFIGCSEPCEGTLRNFEETKIVCAIYTSVKKYVHAN